MDDRLPGGRRRRERASGQGLAYIYTNIFIHVHTYIMYLDMYVYKYIHICRVEGSGHVDGARELLDKVWLCPSNVHLRILVNLVICDSG
jgi:hypothetical protein